jgi:hypothetical protein
MNGSELVNDCWCLIMKFRSSSSPIYVSILLLLPLKVHFLNTQPSTPQDYTYLVPPVNMARLIVLLVAALLSPISHAKHLPKKIKGDSIHLYQWVSDYCDGTPYGYNANLYMQRDKCVSLEARSVRPRFDAKRKQWLQLVNTGTLQCKLLMWNNPGCVGDYNAIMDVPEDFDKCYTTPEHFPKRSAKFTCGRNIVDGLGYVYSPLESILGLSSAFANMTCEQS